MITMFTGLPGNGKTLFALWSIKSRVDKANWENAKENKPKREVFYHNINILDKVTLPWTEFDAEDWWDLPPGSVIVIDECQDVFPKKPNGSALPDFYTQLAKHRHKGFDIFLITQHPSLVDNFVKKLVGQHYHSVRKFGMSRATIWEWQAASDSPEKPSSHKNAVSHKFAFPKQAFSWYKSAEVHTVKRSIPTKLILAILFVIAVPLYGYYALKQFQNRGKVPDAPLSSPGAVPGAVQPLGSVYGPVPGAAFDPVADAKNFIAVSTPRIAGLPHTAPKYDEMTKPTRVPIPAACIQVGKLDGPKGVKCKCYSQQGTVMPVEMNMCMAIARDGYFQEFDGDRAPAGERQQLAQGYGSDRQATYAPPSGSAVSTIADLPPALPEKHPVAKTNRN